MQIAAKMTKPAMAVDRRYVDAAADRKPTRRHDTVICTGKRPDKCTKFGIGAINRAACRKDGPPRLEAIPCLVDFLITRTKDRLEVPTAKTRPGISIPVRPDPPGEVDPGRQPRRMSALGPVDHLAKLHQHIRPRALRPGPVRLPTDLAIQPCDIAPDHRGGQIVGGQDLAVLRYKARECPQRHPAMTLRDPVRGNMMMAEGVGQ